jgi:dephospho-CoA kinase
VTVVALTGGIAAGKTTVTDVFRAKGITVVDADLIAREAVAPGTPALTSVVKRFGTDVLHQDGSLDRAALAEVAFSDEQARADLNAIVHPEVWRLSNERFRAHAVEHPDVPIVYAVPLLAESGRTNEFDAIIVVDAPASQRVARLIESRNMSAEEAQSRVDSQASDDDRRRIADIVLDSSVSVESTVAAASALADALIAAWPKGLSTIATRF